MSSLYKLPCCSGVTWEGRGGGGMGQNGPQTGPFNKKVHETNGPTQTSIFLVSAHPYF